MSLFLSSEELENFTALRKTDPCGADLFWALLSRVDARAQAPGYHGPSHENEWWFTVGEYLSDAAMAHALRPTPSVAAWLRGATLAVVRRPEDDWIGLPCRDRLSKPAHGNLETAHLSWGVSVVLDLARTLFTDDEADEIANVLRERAMPLCRRWMDQNDSMTSWRCALGAGVAVAAAVLDDREGIARCVDDYRVSAAIFQPDGSSGESLQYSNYAAYSLMLTREALLRRDPGLGDSLPATPWNRLPRWQAASLFYRKPLTRWGAAPRARCANFNDSGTIFRPSGDLLLHLAARERETAPVEAGLARWLFDTLYAPDLVQGPHDAATFGFINDWGFLSIPLLAKAGLAVSPVDAGLDELEAFDCGDVITRDAWNGRTILAIHGGGDPLHGPDHLHGDLNSFILVHNRERLLVDPGHSCDQNVIHELERATQTHNTCTFLLDREELPELQSSGHGPLRLEQSRIARVRLDRATGNSGPPADRGARRLIARRINEVHVIGSDAAALYGSPITEFSRYWILCGSHVLFVVDKIRSTKPVRTGWHWLLNNRDHALELKVIPPDRIVARRGNAGMKLFHLANADWQPPQHALVHDAYHPQPGGIGEGTPGSGTLLTWQENTPTHERIAVHAIALDGYGPIAGWHLRNDDGAPVLESPDASERWRLDLAAEPFGITVSETNSHRAWTLTTAHEHQLRFSDPRGG